MIGGHRPKVEIINDYKSYHYRIYQKEDIGFFCVAKPMTIMKWFGGGGT